jgi:Fe-S-cluster containining protein
MNNEFHSDADVTCENCPAACCRQQAMLFNDTDIPEEMVVTDERGEKSMLRLEDGWCVALDRKTMRCSIYEKRPWLCREFEMGGDECLKARADI